MTDYGNGMKFDGGKPRWELLPFRAICEIVKVLTHVVIRKNKPYIPWSWEGVEHHRYVGADMRHFCAYMDPSESDYDAETGFHHLALHATNAIFLLHQALANQNKNRYGRVVDTHKTSDPENA